ncbi:ATP-binding protein [Actinomadura hibisca]|uniref:ATP-binding protein n=1 Tax=Actinomadura hibisca TaxID=68565 RepID=UPI00082C4FF1|nr:ATP-binding protein [Actinomadura hibisca]
MKRCEGGGGSVSARIVYTPGGAPRLGEARAFVRECAVAYLGEGSPLVDDVEIMAGEVLGNAVRYSASGWVNGSLGVMVRASAGRLRVDVLDDGFAASVPRLESPDLESLSGRGLRMVDGLSDAWGVMTGPEPQRRVTVWFEVKTRCGE